MANDADTLPLDEWLKLSDAELAERQRQRAEQQSLPGTVVSGESKDGVGARSQAPAVDARPSEPQGTPTLDEVHDLARSLTPLHQLKLAARLWTALSSTFQSCAIRLQLEDLQNARAPTRPEMQAETLDHSLRRFLFDRSHTSDLYSAPRRFDLATIFVVTAAYSLLLGGLSAFDFGPAVKIVFMGLVTLVAAGQALFHQQANPRGVSVLIGATAYTLLTLIAWTIYPRAYPGSFFFVVVINGLIFGALFGYVAGVLVGGMFLAADRLRGKPAPQDSGADETPQPADCNAAACDAALDLQSSANDVVQGSGAAGNRLSQRPNRAGR